jgi:hypothetical protein
MSVLSVCKTLTADYADHTEFTDQKRADVVGLGAYFWAISEISVHQR